MILHHIKLLPKVTTRISFLTTFRTKFSVNNTEYVHKNNFSDHDDNLSIFQMQETFQEISPYFPVTNSKFFTPNVNSNSHSHSNSHKDSNSEKKH